MDITVTFADGTSHIYKGAPDGTTPEQATERAQKEFGKEVKSLDGGKKPSDLKEIGRVTDQVVRGGVSAVPGMIGDVSVGVAGNETARSMLPPQMRLPLEVLRKAFPGMAEKMDETKFGDVRKTVETLGGALPPVSKPQTELGKVVGNVGESAVSTVLGGGAGTVAQKAVLGAASGGGGEAAARLFGDNPLARLIGSLVGGGVTGAIQKTVPNAQKLVKESTEHMTPEDWAKAKVLEASMAEKELPHLKSQLLGPRSTLDDTVVQASANPSVRPKLVEQVEGAPKAAHQALEKFLVEKLPAAPAGVQNRSEVLTDVQEIANRALKGIHEKSNKAFEAAMPDTKLEYKPERIKAMRDELVALAKSERFGETSDGGKAILKLADDLLDPSKTKLDTSKANQIYVKAFERDGLNVSELPGVRKIEGYVTNAHKVNNLIKDLNNKINDPLNVDYKHLPGMDVKRVMKFFTPEFDAARQAKRAVVEGELNPAKQGLVGQIAQMGGGVKPDKLTARDTALNTVFNPTQPQAAAIKEMGKVMGGDQVGELLREHISKTMQGVLKTESDSPEKFVTALYRSPAQKENIDAALEVSAKHYGQNPEAVKVGFRRLMETLDTFKDMKVASGVSPMATAQQAGANWLSRILQPIMTTRRANDQFVTTQSYKQIADLVTRKDGLAKLQAIAKAPNQSALQQLVVGVMTATGQADE